MGWEFEGKSSELSTGGTFAVLDYTPKTNMTIENNQLKMYLLLKWCFSIVMLVSGSVHVFVC